MGDPGHWAGILNLDELEPAARGRLPRSVFSYVAGGAESGAALRGNRDAFARLALRPNFLVDVSRRTLSTTIWGRQVTAPFGIAPMGAAALSCRNGDLALARAARDEGVPFVLSAASSVALETVRADAPGSWFQCYLPSNREAIAGIVARVERAGYDVLVVTVDIPVLANREHYVRSGFRWPLRVTPRFVLDAAMRPAWLLGTLLSTLVNDGVPYFENYGEARGDPIIGNAFAKQDRSHVTWDDLEAIRGAWWGRLVVKGLLTSHDARRAQAIGVDGVIVSNHGGRQLDHAVAPLDVLAEIVAAVPDLVVMMDGGVRRGTDVVKALALGARMVFVGRPMMYALALAGETGVRRAIRILREEVDRDLALLGCPDVSALGAAHIAQRPGAR